MRAGGFEQAVPLALPRQAQGKKPKVNRQHIQLLKSQAEPSQAEPSRGHVGSPFEPPKR